MCYASGILNMLENKGLYTQCTKEFEKIWTDG